MLVGYEMIIANSALRALLAIYHLISNFHSIMIVLSQYLANEQTQYWGGSLDLSRARAVDARGERSELRVDWMIWAIKHTTQKELTPVLFPLAALCFPIEVEMNSWVALSRN